ncbi:sperm acrosome membrane-associated protein 4 isoform X4 [Oryzias latipes]|uniref:sperm acrosome membrane-associated protein 4 isoform X4 n=1 Tax=Oryzias latipes TaxID=8090 RepID=UPI0009D9902E|nr:sperm acrosome membrane-associated protein 4 isoform X4 [Oryzias latipes]
MGKFLFVVAAVLASFIAAESLVCNKCSFSLLGVCLNSGTVTCSTNTSVCYTGKAVFPSLTSFSGFNNQGCQDTTTGCNATTSASLLGVTYNTTISCCSSDKCNPVTITSGAPSTKMAFTAAATVALLASVFSMH